jgi:hypothetical protein
VVLSMAPVAGKALELDVTWDRQGAADHSFSLCSF